MWSVTPVQSVGFKLWMRVCNVSLRTNRMTVLLCGENAITRSTTAACLYG